MTHLTSSFSILESNYNKLFTQSTKWKNYIPSIKWYGGNNQYHLWLLGNGKDRRGIIRGDFGISTWTDSKYPQRFGTKFGYRLP
ncbi:MAG: hypothetical protein CM15mP112_00190 [Flavobacteriales bacterium]|nr:MAG: hypothetical protein CM15mP112_00190 [Flavobacteriales bacterium]